MHCRTKISRKALVEPRDALDDFMDGFMDDFMDYFMGHFKVIHKVIHKMIHKLIQRIPRFHKCLSWDLILQRIAIVP